MTLSTEVLPAPLGPMMARISPLRTSNDTSRIALMPPNASETFSTDSSASRAAASCSPRALMRRPRLVRPSRRLLQGRRCDRHHLHVADLHPRRDHPLAAVLERHLGRDVGLRG